MLFLLFLAFLDFLSSFTVPASGSFFSFAPAFPALFFSFPSFTAAFSAFAAERGTLFPSLLTGFGLALARGIGEYGSVIYISGNSAKNNTQVVSYVIMQKLERMDYASATAIALVLLIISFVLLFAINIIQIRRSRRVSVR